MTDWFRTWHGAPTDPKWRTVAKRANVRPGDVWAIVSCLYDRASQALSRGDIAGFDAEVMADALGFDLAEVEAIITALEDKGVIVSGRISAWEKYQPKREDGAAERAKAWRETQKSAATDKGTQPNAAERKRSLDTDTDTDTDTERKITNQPQPLTTYAPKEAAAAWESELEQKCREAAGLENDPSAALLVIGPMFDLIEAGWSLENHILPRLRALKASNRKGRSWAFYAKIITEEAKTPPKAQAPPTNGVYPVTESRTDFLARYAAKHGVSDDGKPGSP